MEICTLPIKSGAEPSHNSIVESLRYAYGNKNKIKEMGKNAAKIADDISIENISKLLFSEFSSKRFKV